MTIPMIQYEIERKMDSMSRVQGRKEEKSEEQ